ncbi:MAG: hypothetical protein U1E05_22360 [Patescibacteria group bacterium]|nr:hypothetical protein [Patescibacteria group bacterium]
MERRNLPAPPRTPLPIIFVSDILQDTQPRAGIKPAQSARALCYSFPEGIIHPRVVKTDASGVFSHTIPWAGWWGFAALVDGEEMTNPDGETVDTELGGLIWVKATETPQR